MEDNRVAILAGSGSARLGTAVCKLLDLSPVACDARRFPDGELQVELAQSVRGDDLFLIQATSPPVDQHLIELLGWRTPAGAPVQVGSPGSFRISAMRGRIAVRAGAPWADALRPI